MEPHVLMVRLMLFTFMKEKIQIKKNLLFISKEEDIVEQEIFRQHFNHAMKGAMESWAHQKSLQLQEVLTNQESYRQILL